MSLYAVIAAIILLPVRAVRTPPVRKRGSKPIRAAQEWIDATPLGMLLPYAIGAVLILGVVPFGISLWIAAGMAAVTILAKRRGPRAEPFQIQHHAFERHPGYTPRVRVHTRQRPVGDPRMVDRKRNTVPQRILQSANRR